MTEFRKNQYEEIIDQMMIDEVAGMDNDIREMLSGLETKKKRRAILSILDKDRGLFSRINKLITHMGIGVSKGEYISEVVTMLREYVKVGDVEKKKFGEVMTPISLVEEMLDKLPVEVWSNPSLKWLDSCNGVGIFPSVVVKRLMVGLAGFEPDEELRYKHIVENMIYVGELQPKNMFLFLCSFDPKDEYDLNVYTGSFLDSGFDTHMKEVWGIEKFDIIVGNPPYQTNNEGERKTHPIWNMFVKKSFNILQESGYLVMVHPSGWRDVEGKFKDVQNLIKSKQFLFLSLNDEKAGVNTFGAGTRYDFYCLKNTPVETHALISCQDGVVEYVDISKMDFVPNARFSEVLKLLASGSEERVSILHSFSAYETRKKWLNKVQDSVFIYPCVYTVKQGDVVDTFYSSVNNRGHFNTPKFIWSNGRTRSLGSIVDLDGTYGLTQFAYAIIDDVVNLPNIKKAFDSPAFRELMDACALNHDVNRKIIAQFRKDFWKEFITEPVAEDAAQL